MAKAVFLDRDETLNPDPGYISDHRLFSLYPWVAPELKRLKDSGFLLVVVSNQSGIGRGLISWEQLGQIHSKLDALLMKSIGSRIDHYEICPHTPDDGCECRKPKPELIIRAAEKIGIELSSSYMIGDRTSDYEAGLQAGLKKSFLIQPGDQVSFLSAINQILGREP